MALPPAIARHRRKLLAVAGGLVASLALTPVDLFPCMIVGMALLAAAIDEVEATPHGFGLGLSWGTALALVGIRYVPAAVQRYNEAGAALSWLALAGASVAQSLHWGIGMALAALLRRRLRAPLEVAFPAGVLATLLLPTVFSWSPAGMLSPWPMLLQSAELIGERGVSVLFALAAALGWRVFGMARRGARRAALIPALALVGLVAAMLAHGAWAMRREAREEETASDTMRVRIALVHAAVDPKLRWGAGNEPVILARLKEQTARAEAEGVELSIWPEAAYPYPLPHDGKRAPRGERSPLGHGVKGPLLMGLVTASKPFVQPDGQRLPDLYNSATIVHADGRLEVPHDKVRLMWFGETIPFADQLPWLRSLVQPSGGLAPAAELRALLLPRPAGPLRAGVLNCFEDTIPPLGARIAHELTPHVLVNLTNDAWFSGTTEPEMHMRLGAMRAIELRRDLVRSVNLGVAGWVDASGRVRVRSELTEPGYVVVTPTLRDDGPTLYARFGDWPAIVLAAVAAAISAWRARREPAT